MKRLTLSIMVGLLTSIVLATVTDHIFHTTGIYPPYGEPFSGHGLALLAFTYRAWFAIFGAYITAMLAKDKAKKAVWILGGIGSVLWLVGAIMMWEYAPAWYNIGGALLGIPFALIGGKLYELRVRKLNTGH